MRVIGRSRVVAAACVAVGVAAVAVPAGSAAADPRVRVSARPIAVALTGKAVATTVTVRNTGRRRLAGLTVSVAPMRGVRVAVAGARGGRTSAALKPLRAGRSARVRVSLRLRRAGGGPRSGRVAVKVARRGRTLAATRLVFGAAPSKPGRPGRPVSPPTNPNTLEGRYFWGSTYTLGGIVQNTLWFTGPELVYTDATGSAWPTCTAVGESCRPYSYDAASGRLTIDGSEATLTGRALSFDGDSYAEFGFPPAGARWETYVTYANSSGICPLYCTYYTENLAFRPDGTFVRDAVSSGTGIYDWGVVPPESKGTYEVRADRTLRLAFADGRERIETVALYLDDAGALQPPGDGLLLGGDGYFDIRD